MSLQVLISKINEIKPFADTEVEEQPRATLGGRLARQKKAKEDLKVLTESYRQELLRSALFILVTGSGREEFLKLATETFGFFQADSEKFYADIADQVHPQLYVGKESSPGVLDIVSRLLENKALEVGISGYPMITFRQEFGRIIKDKSDFQSLVKQVIGTQVGTEVVGAQAIKTILPAALRAEHSGKTTPILLSVETADDSLLIGLRRMSRKVGVITAEAGQVDGASVMAAMNELKIQLSDSTDLATATVTKTPESAFGSQDSVEAEGGVITQEMVLEAARVTAETGMTVYPQARPPTAKERKALQKSMKENKES